MPTSERHRRCQEWRSPASCQRGSLRSSGAKLTFRRGCGKNHTGANESAEDTHARGWLYMSSAFLGSHRGIVVAQNAEESPVCYTRTESAEHIWS